MWKRNKNHAKKSTDEGCKTVLYPCHMGRVKSLQVSLTRCHTGICCDTSYKATHRRVHTRNPLCCAKSVLASVVRGPQPMAVQKTSAILLLAHCFALQHWSPWWSYRGICRNRIENVCCDLLQTLNKSLLSTAVMWCDVKKWLHNKQKITKENTKVLIYAIQ